MKRAFFRGHRSTEALPINLCNAVIFNSLVSIHLVLELPTIAEKRSRKTVMLVIRS